MKFKRSYFITIISALLFILVSFSVLSFGCSKKLSDEEIQAAIIGAWQREGIKQDDGTYYDGIILVFSADGKVTEIIYNYKIGPTAIKKTTVEKYSITDGTIKTYATPNTIWTEYHYDAESNILVNGNNCYFKLNA